jgi:hypothetical protein
MRIAKWNEEEIAFLIENYPKMGKQWCIEKLGRSESQIRYKASKLKLRARGISAAWFEKNKKHSELLTGRLRPEQSEFMKNAYKSGSMKPREFSDNEKKEYSERMKNHIKENGHPRGALGMKHSGVTKEKISLNSSKTWKNITEEQLFERNMKAMKTRVKNGTQFTERKNASWKASWREIGGVKKYYRSKWEANYAYYLQWLKEKGEIIDWKHEPLTFWFEGIKRGTASYLPDFWVKEKNGSEAYHEVKGWMDERSITKIKRMAKYHPSVKLVVIDSSSYTALKKSVCSLVPGWEP